MSDYNIEDACFAKACMMIESGMAVDIDVIKLTDMLIEMEQEKLEKEEYYDKYLDFNDEIISIEEVGDHETIDISVTGDQLFYCNDILTKNSMGVVHTADAVFAMIATEEYDEQGQVGMKQLKNRWGDISSYRRFVLGIDKSRMKLYNLEDSAQTKIAQNVGDKKASDTPAFDKSKFGSAEFETGISKRKNLFNMTN